MNLIKNLLSSQRYSCNLWIFSILTRKSLHNRYTLPLCNTVYMSTEVEHLNLRLPCLPKFKTKRWIATYIVQCCDFFFRRVRLSVKLQYHKRILQIYINIHQVNFKFSFNQNVDRLQNIHNLNIDIFITFCFMSILYEYEYVFIIVFLLFEAY